MLPFGPETMLQRVVRLVGEAVDVTVVAAAPGQPLPELPPAVLLACDRRPDRGPLEGLAVGLQALGDRAQAAFVAGCDVPLLAPPFIRRMIELSAGHEIAVAHLGGFDQPLSAVYRTSVLPQIEALLAAGCRRPAYLFDRVRTRRVTAEQLCDADAKLQSLLDVNSPDEHRAALQRAGFARQQPHPAGRQPRI